MNIKGTYYVPYFGGGLRNPCRHKYILEALSKFLDENDECNNMDEVINDLAQYMWDNGIRGSDDISDFETFKTETLRLFQVALVKRFLVFYNYDKNNDIRKVKLTKLGKALVTGEMSNAEIMIRLFVGFRFPNPSTDFYLNQSNFGINIFKVIMGINKRIDKTKQKEGIYKQELVYIAHMIDNNCDKVIDEILNVREKYGRNKKSVEFMENYFASKKIYEITDSSVSGEYCDVIYRMMVETGLFYVHGTFGNQLITISPLYIPYVEQLVKMYGDDPYTIPGTSGFSWNKTVKTDDSMWFNKLITLEEYVDYLYNLELPEKDIDFRIKLCEHQEKILELTDGKDIPLLQREDRIQEHKKGYRYKNFLYNIEELGYNLSQVILNPYMREINSLYIDTDSVKANVIYEASISIYAYNKFKDNVHVFTKINDSGLLECHAPGSASTSYKGRLGTDGIIIFDNAFVNIESTLLRSYGAEFVRECDSVVKHCEESAEQFSNASIGYSLLICPKVLVEVTDYLYFKNMRANCDARSIPITDKCFMSLIDKCNTKDELLKEIKNLYEIFSKSSKEDYTDYINNIGN